MQYSVNNSRKIPKLAQFIPGIYNNFCYKILGIFRALQKNHKILFPNEYPCVACPQGELIVKPSFTKVIFESLVFLEIIHGDLCGSIHPPYGPFPLLYGLNRCLYKVVTCLSSFHTKCCLC